MKRVSENEMKRRGGTPRRGGENKEKGKDEN